MSKRLTDREILQLKLQQMSDLEVEKLLDYLSAQEQSKTRSTHYDSLKDQKNSPIPPNSSLPNLANSDDELLTLLSSSYETRRACQVYEWEVARRRAESRSGSYAR